MAGAHQIRIVYDLHDPTEVTTAIQDTPFMFDEIKKATTCDSIVYIRGHHSGYLIVDSADALGFALSFFGPDSTIVVRPSSAKSPNSSPLIGSPERFQSSLKSRRNDIDPFTLNDIASLDPLSVVSVADKEGGLEIRIEVQPLLEYLRGYQEEGKSVFDVSISAVDANGEGLSIDLSHPEVWLCCLCRNNEEAMQFRAIFARAVIYAETHRERLTTFKAKTAYKSLLFFIRDLMRMSDGGGPEERLLAAEQHEDQVVYFSPIHFGDDVDDVLTLSGPTGVALRCMLERKMNSAAATGVCSSHDLQPILRRFFQIPHRFWESKEFKEGYKAFERAWRKERKKEVKK